MKTNQIMITENTKKTRITSAHFKRCITSQPFFVWHTLEDLKNKFKHIGQDNLFDLGFEDDEELVEEGLGFIDEIELNSDINSKIMILIKDHFNKFISQRFSDIEYIGQKNNIESQISQTKALLNEKKVETIVYPVFSYKYQDKFLALARPVIYDKSTKSLYFLKLSTSTARSDILKMWFDYYVAQKNDLEVNNVFIILIAYKDYQKFELDFYITNTINGNKTPISNFAKASKLIDIQVLKANGFKNKWNIFEIIKNNYVKISPKKQFFFFDLDYWLDLIIKAKSATTLERLSEKDESDFGKNQYYHQVMKLTLDNSINNFNLKFFIPPNKPIYTYDSLEEIINKNPKMLPFATDSKFIINDRELVLHFKRQLEKEVVWFDFEAISPPIPVLDHCFPYQQIVFQISYIVTKNLEVIEAKNIVYDPQKLSLEDFKDLINNLYRPNVKYVVYNKSYEKTRLKEMLALIFIEKHYKNQESYQYMTKKSRKYIYENSLFYMDEIGQKVESILSNIIDLWDLFKMFSLKNYPHLFIPSFKGKSSIKLVEKFIKNNFLDFEYKIEEYSNLKVKNGLLASKIAESRLLDIYSDHKWKIIESDLKKYCQNDVKAMIQIYYLIKKILDTN